MLVTIIILLVCVIFGLLIYVDILKQNIEHYKLMNGVLEEKINKTNKIKVKVNKLTNRRKKKD